MSKVPRMAALLFVLAFSVVATSPASAANWHTNGIAAFASTAAGSARVIIHPSDGGPQVTLQCPTSSATGTINGPTSAAVPWVNAATVTPVFGAAGNCTINGVPGYTFVCGAAELRANSYAGGDTFATAGGGITNGQLTGIDCTLSFMSFLCSTLTGSAIAQYTNPNPLAAGQGRLTVHVPGQSLTNVKASPGCAAVPHGTATWGSPNGAGVGDTTYVIDGPNAPYNYRGT